MLPEKMQRFPVLVTLLFVFCASSGLALSEHICVNDWIVSATGNVPIATVSDETAAQTVSDTTGQQNEGFAPIRIKVVFTNVSCNKYGPHPRAKSKAISRYYKRSCNRTDIFTPEKRALLLEKIIPGAVKLHGERLLVKPVNRIKVPNFTDGLCAEFAVPSDHRTSGVNDADMVLYLSALPTFDREAMWAFTCATMDGRPVVGVMNVGPDTIVDTPQSVRVAAHVMAHALGFTNENLVAKNMVTEKKQVRGKERVRIVNGANTVNATRTHYNCSTAEGMELEDDVMTRLIPSHWERRNAKDELMSAMTSVGYYTALTMGAFADMGYYRVNWSMAETMPWGHQSGCNLLEKQCVSKGTTEYPDMFCTVKREVDCTSDRMAIGRCVIVTNLEPVPSPFQYFESTHLSGDSWYLMDYCPIITQREATGCIDGIAQYMPGSVVGPNARCLRGKELKFDGAPVNAVCANVSCKDNKVHVRLLGDTEWQECPKGATLSNMAKGFSGTVKCPTYEEVCTVRSATPADDDTVEKTAGGTEEQAATKVAETSKEKTINDTSTQPHTQNELKSADAVNGLPANRQQRSESPPRSGPTASTLVYPKSRPHEVERLRRWA